jgi:hypothetical protein
MEGWKGGREEGRNIRGRRERKEGGGGKEGKKEM